MGKEYSGLPQPRQNSLPEQVNSFFAICPYCTKLLAIQDYKWPKHDWDDKTECTQSDKVWEDK
jgi:hypothetical protein